MAHSNRDHLSRRDLLLLSGLGLGLLAWPRLAWGFGEVGHFSPRRLVVGSARDATLTAGLDRWSWEVGRRTSAPTRLDPVVVAADSPQLLDEPFAVWRGRAQADALTASERANLELFLRLGGLLVVDDAEPESGRFLRSARRELARISVGSAPARLPPTHVLFRTFYMLARPVGRIEGAPHVEAIVSGRSIRVLFLGHDLVGALAQQNSGRYLNAVVPGGEAQREQAARFAVNIALYVLCSDYKDDQVHAEWLIRRGARRSP